MSHLTARCILGVLYLGCCNRWFSWCVASHPEGKSRGLCLVQLCAKYRLVSATLSPYIEK